MDMEQLISLESRRPPPGMTILIPPTASHIVTPLILQHWKGELSEHPDQSFVFYIINGLKCGLRIGYQYDCHTRFSASTNMMSAVRNPAPVEEYLAMELAARRIAGLFVDREVALVQVSRFGVMSKGGRPGE